MNEYKIIFIHSKEVSLLIDKKADIFRSGRTVFYSKGFKKTNVSDITKIAGVGVGTFYSFYSSKEKLFLEIYLKENEKFKRCIVESLDLNDDLVTIIKKMTQSFNALNANLILKEWYNRDFHSEIEQYYHEKGIKNDNSIPDFFIKLIKQWRSEGKIRDDINDEIILGLFDSLVYLDIHQGEIGINNFPQMLQLLMEFIMKGLTDK